MMNKCGDKDINKTAQKLSDEFRFLEEYIYNGKEGHITKGSEL